MNLVKLQRIQLFRAMVIIKIKKKISKNTALYNKRKIWERQIIALVKNKI